MCFEGGERAGSARRYLSSLFRLVTFYRSTYIFVSSAFLTFLDTSGIVYRLASSVSLSFGDYCPSISQNIFISVFLFAFSHYFSFFFSHFNTYSLCSLSQNSPYLVTSHQILSFSFSFYSPIRSLLFVCRARLDKSAPLCHDSILERTKRHQILVSLVSLRYFDATSQDIRVSTTVYILRWLPLTLSLTFHIIYKYMSSYLLLYTCVHLHVQASILFLASSVPFILFYNLTL